MIVNFLRAIEYVYGRTRCSLLIHCCVVLNQCYGVSEGQENNDAEKKPIGFCLARRDFLVNAGKKNIWSCVVHS